MSISLKNVTLSGVTMGTPDIVTAPFPELAQMFGLNYWDTGSLTAAPSAQNLPNPLNLSTMNQPSIGSGTITYNQPFSSFLYDGIRHQLETLILNNASWPAWPAATQFPDDLTAGCIFRIPSGATGGTLLGKSESGEFAEKNYLYRIRIEDDRRLSMFWEGGAGVNQSVATTATISDDTDYFVVVTRDSTTKVVKMYLNGVQFDVDLPYVTNATDGGETVFAVGGRYDGASGPTDVNIGLPFVGTGVVSPNGVSLLYQSVLG